jgi:antirestriction protein ArdC
MKREEAMKMIDDGIAELNDVLRQGKSEILSTFLDTLARFHRYSFGNALLIASQRPDSTHVAGFHTWRKLGRFVKKGEHGIGILAPMVSRRKQDASESTADSEAKSIRGFRVAYVFDVSQTDGKPLPEFAAAAGEPGQWLAVLEEAIQESGIALHNDYIFGGALGCSMKGSIVVRPDLDPTKRFAVLLHEWAHELLHQKADDDRKTTRRVRETEAEAVAYTVCRACGIDSTTRSADYIQLYRGNPETLFASLSFVHSAAGEILAALRRRQARHQDQQLTSDVMSLSA